LKPYFRSNDEEGEAGVTGPYILIGPLVFNTLKIMPYDAVGKTSCGINRSCEGAIQNIAL
jgi:hypothetical protein